MLTVTISFQRHLELEAQAVKVLENALFTRLAAVMRLAHALPVQIDQGVQIRRFLRAVRKALHLLSTQE